MRVGIIGGGLMGAALAYFLTQAHVDVTVLEQSTDLGGLNGELRFGNGMSVARYQHAIMPDDEAVRRLCQELGLSHELVFQDAFTGFVHDGQIYPMSNWRDLLAFPLLSLRSRLQLGATVFHACREDNWQSLDGIPVKDWLLKLGDRETFDRIWRPLLEAKFDGVYDQVAATYIWTWLNRMVNIRHVPRLQGKVGYLLGGHYSLIQAMTKAVVERGGRIETQVRVREIEVADGQFQRIRTIDGVREFDVLIAAVATPVFARLIPGANQTYLEKLSANKYLGLICPVVVLDKPLSRYWTLNLTDPNSPFSVVIETPHLTHPKYHIVYLPRYIAPDNDWMGVSDQDIRSAWLGHLKTIFTDFREESVLHFAVSRSRCAEPVYAVHTLDNLIDVQTPYSGLFLVNTQQVYPALPTSEMTIIHARRVAEMISQTQALPMGAVL